MDYGLYTSFLGMRARMRTLEVIASNIANASTSGYKADRLVYRSVEAGEIEALRQGAVKPDAAAERMGIQSAALPPAGPPPPAGAPLEDPMMPSRALGVATGAIMDFSTGSFQQTGRTLDLALSGDGFLVIQTPRGERYTRSGALTLDAAGLLVTMQGDLVIGENGPITIRPGELSMGEDGSIFSGRETMGKLKIIRFEEPRMSLLKEGNSYFLAKGEAKPQPAADTRVLQGMLESSNVQAIDEMVAMMQNNREFESLERSISQMMSMRKAAADIGRI